MDFSLYMIPAYALLVISVLVVRAHRWRATGLIIFFATFLNIFFIDDIEAVAGEHDGMFWFFFDAAVAHILWFAGGGRKIPLLMFMLMVVFCIVHGMLEVSVRVDGYPSPFYREYANVIFGLNIVQLLFLLWGLSGCIKLYIDDARNFFERILVNPVPVGGNITRGSSYKRAESVVENRPMEKMVGHRRLGGPPE